MSSDVDIVKRNFQAGVRYMMSERPDLLTMRDVSKFTSIPYMSLHKIMDGTHSPTVTQCITLCQKAGISANWLLMDLGPKSYQESTHFEAIHKRLKSIELKIKKEV